MSVSVCVWRCRAQGCVGVGPRGVCVCPFVGVASFLQYCICYVCAKNPLRDITIPMCHCYCHELSAWHCSFDRSVCQSIHLSVIEIHVAQWLGMIHVIYMWPVLILVYFSHVPHLFLMDCVSGVLSQKAVLAPNALPLGRHMRQILCNLPVGRNGLSEWPEYRGDLNTGVA